MSASHKQQIKEAVVESLLKAGIGRSYHQRSLREMKAGERLAAWVETEAREGIKRGQGWSLYGAGSASYEAALLLARGTHLSRMGSLVIPLRRLVRLLDRDGDPAERERIEAIPCLYVTEFAQTYGQRAECPLTGWQVQDIEALILDRLDNALPVFTQSDRRLGTEGWWSANLVQRLQGANLEMEVRA